MKNFTGTASIASMSLGTAHYAELGRKGLDSDKNHMRVVKRRNGKWHHTLAVWPKFKRPKHHRGLQNCYDTWLSNTRAELPYGELRNDPAPSVGDTGFLYLVPDYPKDKNVYKFGAFKIKRVVYRPELNPYRRYALHIEKINKDAPLPTPPKPATPKRKRKTPSSGEGTIIKKKKKNIVRPPGQAMLKF